MNVYQIQWPVLIKRLLIIVLRKPTIEAFLKALTAHSTALHTEFKEFRLNCLYRINHNSQICYMEAVLNDYFDSNLRRIRIVNVTFKEPIYFYEPEENREVFHYEPEDNKSVYYRDDDEFTGDGVDFVVMVPPDLQPVTESAEIALKTRMSGQIDYYKLYSKNYKIVWELANI